MDPLTQGLLGAAAAQAAYGHRLPRHAWWVGGGAGMLADLDVLLHSEIDPMWSLLAHRGFTHSLVFIPTGGLIAALLVMWLPLFRGKRHDLLAAATVGYATHAVLDACTSYGTSLWWPLSEARVAWDFISIIDPVFTLILIGALAWTAVRGGRKPAAIGLCVAAFYMALGAVQHERAQWAQERLAASRGQQIDRGRVMPTLGNLIVWRSVYESDGRLYADAIRVPPAGSPQVREGSSLPALHLAEIESGDDLIDLQLYRFHLFTDGYTAYTPDEENVIGDMRYSIDPAGFQPLWGARVEMFDLVPTSIPRDRERMSTSLRRLWGEVVYGFEEPAQHAETAPPAPATP